MPNATVRGLNINYEIIGDEGPLGGTDNRRPAWLSGIHTDSQADRWRG